MLTPPATATADDDGLLTASEVTQLKLDADWVVLSACNTASGNQPGGEALSGLTRAFFYAGARTLIVSHWPVDSNAATMITSTVFKAQRDEPGISPAEAMRRSVGTLMADSHAWNAHPTFWAPFVVVGGGSEPPFKRRTDRTAWRGFAGLPATAPVDFPLLNQS